MAVTGTYLLVVVSRFPSGTAHLCSGSPSGTWGGARWNSGFRCDRPSPKVGNFLLLQLKQRRCGRAWDTVSSVLKGSCQTKDAFAGAAGAAWS